MQYCHPHERSGSHKDQLISGTLKNHPSLRGEFSNFFTLRNQNDDQKYMSGASYLVGGGVRLKKTLLHLYTFALFHWFFFKYLFSFMYVCVLVCIIGAVGIVDR